MPVATARAEVLRKTHRTRTWLTRKRIACVSKISFPNVTGICRRSKTEQFRQRPKKKRYALLTPLKRKFFNVFTVRPRSAFPLLGARLDSGNEGQRGESRVLVRGRARLSATTVGHLCHRDSCTRGIALGGLAAALFLRKQHVRISKDCCNTGYSVQNSLKKSEPTFEYTRYRPRATGIFYSSF